jgi:hypothetical protein
MLKWRLIVNYDFGKFDCMTSYTSISAQDLKITMKRVRGGNAKDSDLRHDFKQTTPVDPWIIQTAFDKIAGGMFGARKIVSIKIEKGVSSVNILGG